jgi:putative ubiquitin-RnfH superfamily antitoxin RatB of RatAB toxin-antitoxin module
MAEQANDALQVWVIYATPQDEFVQPMRVAPGTTIVQAIEGSGVLSQFPEISLVTQPVGIYGKKKTLDTVLRERDRIEIYRPLVADPKDSRRKRAAKKTGPAAGPAPVADPA